MEGGISGEEKTDLKILRVAKMTRSLEEPCAPAPLGFFPPCFSKVPICIALFERCLLDCWPQVVCVKYGFEDEVLKGRKRIQ